MSTERGSIEDAWVIWSRQHDAWWCANECGYTDSVLLAGVYTKERAEQIEARSKSPAYADRLPEMAERLVDRLRLDARRASVAELLVQMIVRTCTWRYMDFPESDTDFESACGNAWSFTSGGLAENHMTYCNRCGGQIVLEPPPKDDADDVREEVREHRGG